MATFALPTPARRSSVATTVATTVAAAAARPGGVLALLARRVATWAEVRRQRRQLLAMSDHMLHDLGLSRADAEGEASRPFWDPPGRWR